MRLTRSRRTVALKSEPNTPDLRKPRKCFKMHLMKPLTELRLIDLPNCHYCGAIADSLDHVPPVAAREMLNSLGIRYSVKDVSCCRECNSAIGANGPFSLRSRRQIAKEHLIRKYRSYLEIPEWTDSELARMGDRMQQYINAGLNIKEYILARIRWPNVTNVEKSLLLQETGRNIAVPNADTKRSLTARSKRKSKGFRKDLRNLEDEA